MTAEFANHTLSVDRMLRHCFRKQAARVHEYGIFLQELYVRYEIGYPNNFQEWKFVHTKGWQTVETHLDSLKPFPISQPEIHRFTLKYNRLINAKLVFERLNGDYELYR